MAARITYALLELDLVSGEHVHNAEASWCFGQLINNTDMHPGNLSLAIDGAVFRILPVYDMCSMGFAPRSGEVTPFAFTPPDITGIHLSDGALYSIRQMARGFWQRVRVDARISDGFRAFLDGCDLNAMGSLEAQGDDK